MVVPRVLIRLAVRTHPTHGAVQSGVRYTVRRFLLQRSKKKVDRYIIVVLKDVNHTPLLFYDSAYGFDKHR